MTLQAHMFEGLSEDQKQQVAADLSEMDAKLPGGGLTLQRVMGDGCWAAKSSDIRWDSNRQ